MLVRGDPSWSGAPIDHGGGPPDNGSMETRVAAMESTIVRIDATLDFMRQNMATKADIGEVRSDLHKSTIDTQRWMIATVIGLFLGFGGLFLAMSTALKPAQLPQAPVIINIPTPAATPSK
jgi:hypothetical protein